MSIIARAVADLALPPSEAPEARRRALRPAPLASTTEEPAITLDAVPAVIQAAVAAYLAEPAPGRALLLALPAGSGKTTAMVQTAEGVAAAGSRVLYAGPRHDFFTDLQALASHPAWWYEWQPRRIGSETRDPTCRWAPQIARWMHRGYPAIDFCKNARVCGWNYLNNECPYHAQRRITHPIIFAQHQHVALRHPLMDQASLLIGDESPLSAFLNPWVIPSGSIVVREATGELEQLLRTLHMLVHTAPPPGESWSGPLLLAELGGAAAVAELCECYATLRPGIDLESPDLRHPDAVDQLDYAHLPVLLSLLNQEARAALDGLPDYVRRIRVTVDGLTLLMRRRPGPLPAHIIWCDATGDGHMYERLLGMPVEVVRPHVQLAGRVYQVWAALNNKGSLTGSPDGSDREVAHERKRAALKAQVTQVIARGPYHAPAMISYKSIIADLADDAPHGHFGAERGTNRMGDCDALIVVGAPQPPQPALIDMAAMLYDERIAPFNTAWTVREIAYESQPWAWPIGGFWDDPDLHMLVTQTRDAELMQAVHRARPLRRAVDVWLLTNAPVPGLPVELVSLRELFDAPDGVDPYRWPALRAWAAFQVVAVGRVTVPDIAAHVGVQLAAARRYAEALARQDGYHLAPYASEGRGRPPLALTRNAPPTVPD